MGGEESFNEACSIMVLCQDQAQIDEYWERLSFVPEAEQCGWLKDRFGISWQIVPEMMSELLSSATEEESTRITEAFLGMKKLDIRTLEQAKRGA